VSYCPYLEQKRAADAMGRKEQLEARGLEAEMFEIMACRGIRSRRGE
jgi:hypothetical protein